VTQWPTVSAALIKSGIRHIRDGSPQYYEWGTRLAVLGEAGIHHGLGFDTTSTAAIMTKALAEEAPYVDFVEPQNEYDSYADKDASWVSQLVAEQHLLYATVRANPAYNGITVIGPAMRTQHNYAKLGNLTNVADVGNLHNATCNQNPGTTTDIGIQANIALVHASTSKPVWTTETGYSDNMNRTCGLPDDIIAKYDPRMVAERFMAGEPRTYFYEFCDMPVDAEFGATGLLYATGQPKPQYTSLASMIAILADRGPSFEPTRVQYTLSGNVANVNHLLLQKRDGTYILMLWIEMPAWKSLNYTNVGGNRIDVAPQAVTVSFPTRRSSASMYHYNDDQQLTLQSEPSNAATFSISVTDTISFFEFK